ncbi:hypothetical protein KSD_65240 [Ktedonobacter sp. SOSP1-85]|uniref:C39 family peptidase n=1 Tax=Ktedonobacter sp. SOSP1-85 TaxID=2778367 RepID=UPI0019155619|nr:C39 family peptidase [Ktedonobacter sp. SOSP1-85]GHO78753.1 hypothetical protein KSD_65240 [Ktedonobacter sp. SOSP1-85]
MPLPQTSHRLSSYLRRLGIATLLALFCLTLALGQSTHAATAKSSKGQSQYDEFWQQSSSSDFSTWTLNGVAVSSSGTVILSPHAGLSCTTDATDGGSTSFDATSQLCQGQDPYAAGAYNGNNYYNGGSFYYGTITSPIHTTAQTFTDLVASWNATTPTGTWVETHVRVLENGTWTHWYKLPVWASDFSTIKRHSINGQSDTTGNVATDTFQTGSQPASAYQLSLTLFTTSPSTTLSLRRVTAMVSYNSTTAPTVNPDQSVWGTNLNVPQRSQMLPEYQGLGYGGGGEVWCSPTSTSMILAYWSTVLNQPDLNQTVPDTARDTYDYTYQGTGNWPFNTAYAGSHGLHAYVTRMYSMSQIEQWIKAGVPIAISIAYKKGELPGTPIPSSSGHLLVVRGFSSTGDVITNDPAASTDAGVQITYSRSSLQAVWLKYSYGTVYVMYPENWTTPTTNRLTNWS